MAFEVVKYINDDSTAADGLKWIIINTCVLSTIAL